MARLEAKNAELLKEKKKAREALQSAQEELNRLQTEKAAGEGDVESLKRSLQSRYEKEISETREALEAERKTVRRLVVDNGLKQALESANVAPPFREAAGALIKSRFDIAVDDGAAYVGENPLADVVGQWSQSEEGRAFLAAPDNAGGGADGGARVPNGGVNPWAKGQENLTEQARLMKTDPGLAARMKQEAGGG